MIEKIFNFVQFGGLPFIFLFLLLEGNPVIGTLVPGAVMVIFLGFFVGSYSFFNEYISLLVVFISSFLGDLIGFFMGKKLKISKKYEKSSIFLYSKKFLKKNGLFSIILGRLFNPTRAFIPFICGISKIETRKFVFVAFISNIIFTLLFFYLGYFFGLTIIDKINNLIYFLVFIFIYLFFIYFIYKSFKKFEISNRELFEDFRFKNIIIILSLILILSFLIFLKLTNLVGLFNEYFSFIYFSFFTNYLIILIYLNLFLLIFLIFFILFYFKNFESFINFFWSFFLVLFFILFGKFFIGKNYSIDIYSSLIIFVYLSFFLTILIKNYFNCYKNFLHYFELFIIFFITFTFYLFFLLKQNFFEVFFTFIYAVIISEFLIILSHFEFIDKSFCENLKESCLFKTKKE
jgi:membrane-associated protein